MVDSLFAHKRHPVEPLGIGYLASSIARGGHGIDLMLTEGDLEVATNEVCEKLDRGNYKVFGQSVIFGSHGYAIELGKRVKERHPEVISFLGGPASTFTPKLINRGFDAICRYEGENPFLEFMNALEYGNDVGNIPNLWVRENPDLYHTEVKTRKQILDQDDPNYKKDSGYDPGNNLFVNDTRMLLQEEALNDIPFPEREKVLYVHDLFGKGPIFHFIHTRGCAFGCFYCHVHLQNKDNRGKGSPVRRRANESMAEEVLETKLNRAKAGVKDFFVYFQDDVFGPSYKAEYTKDFGESFKELGVEMHIHTRYDINSRDPNIAKFLSEAGVTGTHMAIEAGNEYIRNKIHGRGMSDKQILTGAEYMRKYGIRTMTQNILGAVGETKENMLETLDINQVVNPTFASASIFQPFPGTKELEIAAKTGSLPVKYEDELIDMFDTGTFYNDSILIMDPEQKTWLKRFQKFFAIAVEEKWSHEKVEKVIKTYPEGGAAEEELELMYRTHRAEKDNELYGVKLEEVVLSEK
tara:strand:+ start:1264 stop:2832 length:1569 start_codon:yes stop_codon:yes gene_type:complete